MNAWTGPIKAELFGSFVKMENNEFLKTAHIGSSVDVLKCRNGFCSTEVSYRFREVLYRRVERGGSEGVVVWKDGKAFWSGWHDRVYYLPFHRCFIGRDFGNIISLFSENVFFKERCVSVFVLGNFLFFSYDGKLFGLYDSEYRRKIEPFFELYDQRVTLTHFWTDEYYPVKIKEHYYLVDPHGNCFCKRDKPIYKYENLFATEPDSRTICFGLNANKEICVLPEVFQAKVYNDELMVREWEGCDWQDIDAYGNVMGQCYQRGYYGERTNDSKSLTTYSRQPMKLNRYYLTGERLFDCFWKISYTDGKCPTRYGVFNEETNEVITEPMFDDVKVSDRGIECILGSMVYFLDHFGKPISVEQNEFKYCDV